MITRAGTYLLSRSPFPGDWKGCRDACIDPDWLLVYRVQGNKPHLALTGSHANLFKQ